MRFLVELFSALKIHISESTQKALDAVGGYKVKMRGQVEMKVCILFKICVRKLNVNNGL